MSERKVLNKYYPPDYDPSKIPKLKRAKDRQYVIRVMAPFNMRCKTCGNYIYKGTKFNARMETVQDENYLGLRIYRFYIKCTKCVAEITFKTDPENMDYSIEHGATRNFEAEKLIEQEEKRLQEKREADEANPMKMLEIRTRDSKREMEMMESLEELRELNQRNAGINFDEMLRNRQETEEERIAREKEEEDLEIREILNKNTIRRLPDSDDEGNSEVTLSGSSKRQRPSDILTQDEQQFSGQGPAKKLRKKTTASLGIIKKKVAPVSTASDEKVCLEEDDKPSNNASPVVDSAGQGSKPTSSHNSLGIGLLCDYSSSDSSDFE